MFQLVPVFLGLFDSTVQKLMNGFRDIFMSLLTRTSVTCFQT